MSSNKRKPRKKKNSSSMIIAIAVYVLLILVLLLTMSAIVLQMKQQKDGTSSPDDAQTGFPFISLPWLNDEPQTEKLFHGPATPETSASETEKMTETVSSGTLPTVPFTNADLALKEEDIYTFLQGPKAWASRTDWSGSWNSIVYYDQTFSVFGCGLCDLANIYSTLTPFDCSPIDMMDYAQTVSKYAPTYGFGAIDWPYMKKTLKTVGISSKLKRKDKTYESFQQNIASSISAIVLVSSAYDDTYWHNVSGHYVNIWLYDPTDDTVFLGDSGDPSHNRQRIPLRYIYDALKTSGQYQYQLITSVDPSANTWQHDGIDLKWRKPKYYKK